MCRSLVRNHDWRSFSALMESAATTFPNNSAALNNYALVMLRAPTFGDPGQAAYNNQQALALVSAASTHCGLAAVQHPFRPTFPSSSLCLFPGKQEVLPPMHGLVSRALRMALDPSWGVRLTALVGHGIADTFSPSFFGPWHACTPAGDRGGGQLGHQRRVFDHARNGVETVRRPRERQGCIPTGLADRPVPQPSGECDMP